MKRLTSFLLITAVFLVAWLSYVAGYHAAFKIGVDRNLSIIYSGTGLRIKILDLLSKNETTRAFSALAAATKSDISIMKEYQKIENDMSYMDTLKSSLSGFGHNSGGPSKVSVEEIDYLEVKLKNIGMPQ